MLVKDAISILEIERDVNCRIICGIDDCELRCGYIEALDLAINALYLLKESGVIK